MAVLDYHLLESRAVIGYFSFMRMLCIYRSLSFWTFSFGHFVGCFSSINGIWLPLWYFQTLRCCKLCTRSIHFLFDGREKCKHSLSTKLKDEEIRKKSTPEKSYPKHFRQGTPPPSLPSNEKKVNILIILKYNTHSNHVVDLLSS